jgi:hypothetical protein
MGRKPLPSAQQIAHARKPVKLGEYPGAVASELKVSRSTIYRALGYCFPVWDFKPELSFGHMEEGFIE